PVVLAVENPCAIRMQPPPMFGPARGGYLLEVKHSGFCRLCDPLDGERAHRQKNNGQNDKHDATIRSSHLPRRLHLAWFRWRRVCLRWGRRFAADLRDATITMPSDRLYVTGRFRRVTQGGAQFVDRAADTVVEINESPRFPEFSLERVSGHGRTRIFQQETQDSEGALLKLGSQAVFAEFERTQVEFKRAESNQCR